MGAANHALQKLSAAAPAQAAPAKAEKAEKIVKPQPKAVESAKAKETPAKETDPNAASKAKKAPKVPAPPPPLVQKKKKGPVKAKTVPPPGPEAVKVVNEQLRLMEKEKAAAKASLSKIQRRRWPLRSKRGRWLREPWRRKQQIQPK